MDQTAAGFLEAGKSRPDAFGFKGPWRILAAALGRERTSAIKASDKAA